MTLRRLSLKEVEQFASRQGVRRIAVENFLITVTANETIAIALANLDLDTQLYKWNAATVNAIRDGILLSAKPEYR